VTFRVGREAKEGGGGVELRGGGGGDAFGMEGRRRKAGSSLKMGEVLCQSRYGFDACLGDLSGDVRVRGEGEGVVIKELLEGDVVEDAGGEREKGASLRSRVRSGDTGRGGCGCRDAVEEEEVEVTMKGLNLTEGSEEGRAIGDGRLRREGLGLGVERLRGDSDGEDVDVEEEETEMEELTRGETWRESEKSVARIQITRQFFVPNANCILNEGSQLTKEETTF